MLMNSKYVKINKSNNTNVFVSLEYIKKLIEGLLEEQNIQSKASISFENGDDGLQIFIEMSYPKKMNHLKDSIVAIHNSITNALEENISFTPLNVVVINNFNLGKS